MENAVYWKGKQVGIEMAGRISWFPSAPPEAIASLDSRTPEHDRKTEERTPSGSAANLIVCADMPRR